MDDFENIEESFAEEWLIVEGEEADMTTSPSSLEECPFQEVDANEDEKKLAELLKEFNLECIMEYLKGKDERNFRSSYYEKVGCYSVEEKKSLNKLLQDNVRNHSKLKQFCLSYTVPTTQRSFLWSIILGVQPLHKNSTAYITEQLKAVYEDLLRAVSLMRYVDATTPKSRVFYIMWLLENKKLHPGTNTETKHNFIEIVKVLLEVFDDDVETYWIAKEFYSCTIEIQMECPRLKELAQLLLKREDIALLNHLEKLGAFLSNNIIDKWCATCFAGVVSEASLVKVWDKICGGSRQIITFVLVELVKTFRESVLSCNSQSELRSLMEQVKDQDAVIVNKAIKTWQSNKNHNEITVH